MMHLQPVLLSVYMMRFVPLK